MGLRQLYFLLSGLMDRLAYISWGLSAIMLFIGIKLILHALHENGVPVFEIGIGASLSVIIGVMAVTVVGSLLKTRMGGRRGKTRQKDAGGPRPWDRAYEHRWGTGGCCERLWWDRRASVAV